MIYLNIMYTSLHFTKISIIKGDTNFVMGPDLFAHNKRMPILTSIHIKRNPLHNLFIPAQ
jgi:hypothetical protein